MFPRRTTAFARLLAACLVASLAGKATAFKAEEFKTCSLSSFCDRQRDTTPVAAFYAVPETLSLTSAGALQGKVRQGSLLVPTNRTYLNPELDLALAAYEEGFIRLKITEPGRYEVHSVLSDDLEESRSALSVISSTSDVWVLGAASLRIVLSLNPLRVEVAREGSEETLVTFNGQGLFNFERYAIKAEGEDWSELFRSHTDSRTRGPASVSLDLTFHDVKHVYGLPERASPLDLPPTKVQGQDRALMKEPYRLYNLDVFEYLHDHPFGLYGSIPFLMGHRKGSTVGALWLNAAEMYVDIFRTSQGGSTSSQWMAESGAVDLFLFVGDEPRSVVAQLTRATGKTKMPQMFSLGYHQCRWNYKDEADVAQVDANMDTHQIPCDVIWLDIEHTDGKRYMTWNTGAFPTPQRMQRELSDKGRKMVTIVDPHVKKDEKYVIYSRAKQLDYFVKKADGNDYDGWCWPGSSTYLDVTNPDVRRWWSTLFTTDSYKGSTDSLYIWNDMNEPSVFNGPEITMPKDALHYGGVEHRDVHNVYGYYYHMATAQGLETRGRVSSPLGSDRPFVLSRAFFAGTQRVGPIWTGDNTADWHHLRLSVPMLLSLGVSGLTFSGADVGGFFGNPDAQLLTRWYQLGIFYPFFRAHAHIETKRREPWLFGDETLGHIRAAVELRYSLLPYTYTLFREAHVSGSPVMRPLVYEFPLEEATFGAQDAFMFGPSLFIQPITQENSHHVSGALPSDDLWYELGSGLARDPLKSGRVVSRQVDMSTILAYVKGGSVVPRKMRPRRSTAAMRDDPYTLLIALDRQGAAEGAVYLDDGQSMLFDTQRQYVESTLSFRGSSLECRVVHKGTDVFAQVERIVVLGVAASVSRAFSAKGDVGSASWEAYGGEGGAQALVIRKPGLSLAENWTIQFN